MGLAGAAAAAMGASVLLADCEATALLVARLNTWPWRQRVRTRRVNWQTDRLSEQFDTIIGADILYERAQWEFLDEFWKSAIANGGSILLGEPGRSKADEFAEWAKEHAWKVEKSIETIALSGKSVRIFELRRVER
jgi:predicted nicotinamide N-methyase